MHSTPMIAAALLLLLMPVAAQAQTGDRQAARQACGSDVQRLCKGTRPGGGRILACLRAHEAELSAPCRSYLQSQRPAQ